MPLSFAAPPPTNGPVAAPSCQGVDKPRTGSTRRQNASAATRSSFSRLIVALGLLFAVLRSVCAAEISVSASLTENTIALGEAVQLQVKVDGARRPSEAPEVAVNGLGIRYLGPSQSTSMRVENGRVSSESHVIHVYSVQPQREGTFTIPSIDVEVDGQHFQTQPIALKVGKSGSNDPGGRIGSGDVELILPKRTAYLGEVIPVEIRLTFDSRVRWEPNMRPELSGEGFTQQKISATQKEHVSQNGRDVDVLSFQTAITPSKAGRLQIGPAQVTYIAQVPRAQNQRRSRGMFSSPFDDIFSDPFFAERQQFTARAEAVELDVKPLPAAGKPGGFSGAVGHFQFSAEGSPKQLKVGDPLTMKLSVTGRGNFDRVEAPTLTDSGGWRAYPPSVEFKPENDLGISGTKKFEMAVIPETKKTKTPAFEFSYFDPDAARYVTLKNSPTAITVEGGAPPPPPPLPSSNGASSSFGEKPSTTPAPAAASDILGVRYDAGRWRASFEPLYLKRGFWLAQLAPLVVLLALLSRRLFRKDANAGRSAALRREKAALRAKLRRGDLSEAEFLETAAQFVQLETALATGREPRSIDASGARAALRLDDETAQAVDEIFGARAELLYAGSHATSAQASPTQRTRVLAALERIERPAPRG